eukprot:TRINITY_DN3173_c0_g1_i1.p1 TRINITY_DN3173_c0_g1~~TRINITY_DN3173_c0_g1_i1.p1  ORF type:complete len:171 (+),score=28.78 TRINITY_DN3173_c0_g1_i1:52-564(+)
MYEMLMSEEHRTQHETHRRQIEALDEMWKVRLDKVIDDTRSREEDLKTEIDRLRSRCKQQQVEKQRDMEVFAAELKKFLTTCQVNGYTSVPLILQKLEAMTHGLVDQATDTPIGTSTPLPPLTAPSVSLKRSRNSDCPKVSQFTRTPAVKRTLDMDEEDEVPDTTRVRIR